jgi:hypothetical protein
MIYLFFRGDEGLFYSLEVDRQNFSRSKINQIQNTFQISDFLQIFFVINNHLFIQDQSSDFMIYYLPTSRLLLKTKRIDTLWNSYILNK